MMVEYRPQSRFAVHGVRQLVRTGGEYSSTPPD